MRCLRTFYDWEFRSGRIDGAINFEQLCLRKRITNGLQVVKIHYQNWKSGKLKSKDYPNSVFNFGQYEREFSYKLYSVKIYVNAFHSGTLRTQSKHLRLLTAVNHWLFSNKLHLRCLTGFRIRLFISYYTVNLPISGQWSTSNRNQSIDSISAISLAVVVKVVSSNTI